MWLVPIGFVMITVFFLCPVHLAETPRLRSWHHHEICGRIWLEPRQFHLGGGCHQNLCSKRTIKTLSSNLCSKLRFKEGLLTWRRMGKTLTSIRPTNYPFSLQAHGKSLSEFVEKHQDQSKNALRKSMEAAFKAWVEELRADQAQFCADKVLMLGDIFNIS